MTIMKTFCGIVSLFTTYPTSFQIYSFLKTMLIYGLIGIVVGELMEKAADKLLSMEAFPAIR
jgi:hypothetical protein